MDFPIAKYKEEIISMSKQYPVILISGQMGCGKSTQVPLFILDHYRSKRIKCNIIVTQPRRIATISIAKYMAKKLNCTIGTKVAYQVGFQQLIKNDVDLLYCTTGILLNKLITWRNFSVCTHIIIDEVHERDQDIDLTLFVVREFMKNFPNIKVILMSSTANLPILANYFAYKVRNITKPAPILKILTNKLYPVDIYYLDDLVCYFPELRAYKNTTPTFDSQLCVIACKLLKLFDQIDLQDCHLNGNEVQNSVLIFLPGMFEIKEMNKLLIEYQRNEPACKWWIKVLHSRIDLGTQESVFALPPLLYRKVILATNIAESSITIPDVKYVIDFCRAKESQCDIVTNVSQLVNVWCSKSSCDQRMGRAGRVMPGKVFRLVMKETYEDFYEFALPAILQKSLDALILKVKILDMGEPGEVLQSLIDKPDLSDLKNDILKLKEMGALLRTSKGRYNQFDGDLTYLGRVLAALPVSLYMGKFIFLGSVFGILEQTVRIACCITSKNLFTQALNSSLKEYKVKRYFACSSDSDCIAALNIFNEWRSLKDNPLKDFEMQEKEWANQFMVNLQSLKQAWELRLDIMERLDNVGFTSSTSNLVVPETYIPVLLPVVMAGAFYPNYFIYSDMRDEIINNEREIFSVLHALNPNSTVYMKGIFANDTGTLYTDFIRRYLHEVCQGTQLYFQNNKVLISFKNSDDSANVSRGRILRAVYEALKLKQLNNKLIIPILPADVARKRVGIFEKESSKSHFNMYKLPSPTTFGLPFPWENESIPGPRLTEIYIEYYHNPNRFWALIYNERGRDLLSFIEKTINNRKNLIPVQRLKSDKVYVVLHKNAYRRCRILSLARKSEYPENDTYVVYLIDSGESCQVSIKSIKDFDDVSLSQRIDKIPDLALECYLSGIEPIVDRININGRWNKAATDMFIHYTRKIVKAKIYSAVYGVVSIELYEENQNEANVSLNELLIREHYATRIDECYSSRSDHLTQQNLECRAVDCLHSDLQSSDTKYVYIEPPSIEDCVDEIELSGPFSPLEVNLKSNVRAFSFKNIKIQNDSVNSVLLHTFPEESYERMIIAADVEFSDHSGSFILQHTTKMLDMRGLSSLMCLLFAPTVELRVNPKRTRLTGALCGLGYDEYDRKSMFPAHDAEITFDFNLNKRDIARINRVRAYLNSSMSFTEYKNFPNDGKLVVQDLMELIRDYEPEQPYVHDKFYKWNLLPKRFLMKPDEVGGAEDITDQVYHLIWDVALNSTGLNVEDICENIEVLQKYGKEEYQMEHGEELRCMLCDISGLSNSLEIRMHLMSKLHCRKLMQLHSNM